MRLINKRIFYYCKKTNYIAIYPSDIAEDAVDKAIKYKFESLGEIDYKQIIIIPKEQYDLVVNYPPPARARRGLPSSYEDFYYSCLTGFSGMTATMLSVVRQAIPGAPPVLIS